MPELRRIAHEFYDDVPRCKSWPGTLLRFVIDPRVTIYDRVLREKEVGKKNGALQVLKRWGHLVPNAEKLLFAKSSKQTVQ